MYADNSIRRQIMLSAWARRREDGLTMAAALVAAWRRERKSQAYIRRLLDRAKANGGNLALSPDLTRSPKRKSLAGSPYAGTRAYQAARTTARFGA